MAIAFIKLTDIGAGTLVIRIIGSEMNSHSWIEGGVAVERENVRITLTP